MITLTITCDGCGRRWETDRACRVGDGGVMRLYAEKDGWIAPPHSGKDYCPGCRHFAAKPANRPAPPAAPGVG